MLTYYVSDADGDILTFNKVFGPAWLSVASDGSLSRTTGAGDVGINIFDVTASDNITAEVPLGL